MALEIFKLIGSVFVDTDKADQSLQKTDKQASSLGQTFVGGVKAVGNFAKAAVTMGAAVAGSLVAVAESTREYRTEQGKLQVAFETSNFTAEQARSTYTALNGVLGDSGQAVEAANHLAMLCDTEEELAEWTDICTGVYATFGDSLPIEGLTEAANETAKVGQLTGSLADALNWAGVNEEAFQAQLDACASEQERAALITETLNGLYSESADAYKEVNADVIAANEAQDKLTNSLAAVGGAIEPVITAVKGLGASMLESIVPGVEAVGAGIKGLLAGEEGAAEAVGTSLSGIVTTLLNKAVTLLPALVTIATSLIGTLASALIGMLPTIVTALMDIIVQLIAALAELLPQLIEQIILVLPDVLAAIVEGLLEALPVLVEGIMALVELLAEYLPEFIPFILDKLPELLAQIVTTLVSLIPTLLQGAITLFMAVAEAIPAIIPAVVEAIPELLGAIIAALVVGLEPVWQAIWGWLSGVGANVWGWITDLGSTLTGAISSIGSSISSFLSGLWEGIKGIFRPVAQFFTDAFKNAFNGVKNAFSTAKTFFSGIWSGIKGAFGSVTGWFKDTFHAAWTAVKNVFSTGGKIFEGIKEGITSVFTTVVNSIIRGINTVISIPFNAINNVLNKLRNLEILGVSPFSWISTFSVPQIPELYEGGVLEKGEVGLLEGNGAEAVVPLHNNEKWTRAVAKDMDTALGGTAGGPVVGILTAILEAVSEIAEMGLYLDRDTLVGGLAKPMDAALGQLQFKKARA